MLLLLSKSDPSVRRMVERIGPFVGRLFTPRTIDQVPASYPWAADNDAFNGFEADRFLRMLDVLEGRPDGLFVTAPDVVGDHDQTCELWDRWAPFIRAKGQRPAFVLQDGCLDFYDVPHDAGALFVGGSTEFKLGEVVEGIVAKSKERPVAPWVHMGRVNTIRRLRYAASIGCDSVDGTKWARFQDTWVHQLHILPNTQTRLKEVSA